MHRTVATELDLISKIPLGVSPCALSRAISVSLGVHKHRGEALGSTSPPHKKSRSSCLARAPSRSQLGGSFLRELLLAFVSRLGSSKLWLRRPYYEAYRKLVWELLTRHLYRCSLAGVTGPFPPTEASSLCLFHAEMVRKYPQGTPIASLLRIPEFPVGLF